MFGRELPEPELREEDDALVGMVRDASRPLRTRDDLDPLLERIGDARVVLLGEASHGTHEFYAWRTAITERLVMEKGFSFVAVEGDWPDCRVVDRWVKGEEQRDADAEEVLQTFRRWPTWMWANEEVAELAAWLRGLNEGREAARRVGFYGLDVYSLWDSLHEVIRYLDRADPEAARTAREAWRCFEPFGQEAQQYARATARLVPRTCEDEVIETLMNVRRHRREAGDHAAFDAEQNALVAANAESYYRAMVRGGPASWNVRDHHMVETLARLLDHHGPASKAVVWEHNTHVGDARATDMAADGMVNVGQLCRERWTPPRTFTVGFSTYEGTVVAGRAWDAPMEVMRVPPAIPGSWDDVLHQVAPRDQLLLMEPDPPTEWTRPRGQRAIGVVYNPEFEAFGNYVPTVLPWRYDAVLFHDRSEALRPLRVAVEPEREPPETFPSGM